MGFALGRTWKLCAAFVAVLVLTGAASPLRAAAASPHRAAGQSTATPVPLGRRVAFGAFAAGQPGPGSQVDQLQRLLGGHLAIASSYQGLGDVFPDASELADARAGHTLLISWDLSQSPASRYTAFTNGTYDAYLAKVAAAVKAFGKTIYIRPWPEMNGDWTSFQPTASGSAPAGGTPAQFVAAWRHLVGLFRSHGATNARWVFNPYAATYAQTTPVAEIWPGAAYVDVLGLDGFNWGTGGAFRWQSFATIMQAQYNNLVALDPSAPVWICEFASKEPAKADGAPIDRAHSKAVWYQTLLGSTGFTHVTALVMFDIRKERDWRVESDPAALAVVAGAVRAAAPTNFAALPRQ